MIKDYEEFSVKIDDLNDACNTCDALQRGNSMTSPVRRSKYWKSITMVYMQVYDMVFNLYGLPTLSDTIMIPPTTIEFIQQSEMVFSDNDNFFYYE